MDCVTELRILLIILIIGILCPTYYKCILLEPSMSRHDTALIGSDEGGNKVIGD